MTAPAWLDELSIGAGPPWHAMGTRALDEKAWLLPADADAPAQLAMKRDLLATAHDVVSGTSGSDAMIAAARETAELVGATTGKSLALAPGAPPLEAAALLVQEDLCVLVHRDGHWRLEAGVVCFPSMWRLSDKLGLPVAAIHDPVPYYAEELAERVDRFIDRLKVERPVWRRNWFVHDSPELHLPEPPPPTAHPPRVPADLWLRSERQTLRRLPVTGAVVFTIRTQQVSLSAIAERRDIATRLAAAIRSWSPELIRYRGAQPWRDAVVSWLENPGAVQPTVTP